jgi:L-histidine Nalpha-methyltransferase
LTAPAGVRAAGGPRVHGTHDPRLRREVLHGLLADLKTLPPKLFYDARGAALFERICELDEYHVTRAELEILRAHADAIAELAGPRCALVEYGSGAGVKVRLLLDALESPLAYVPIDVSREQLAHVARSLAGEYRGLAVQPLCADYTGPLRLPRVPAGARRLAFFPGSTIGNFHPTDAAAFLRRVRGTLGPNGALVLGVDRPQDAATLHAAYDDREGVTAAFNLNVLARLNRELDADFALERFRHRAFVSAQHGRVEMHLESVVAQTVGVAGVRVHFGRRETIWTESSYKYDRVRLGRLAEAAGFRVRRLWTDDAHRFWVAFLTVV